MLEARSAIDRCRCRPAISLYVESLTGFSKAISASAPIVLSILAGVSLFSSTVLAGRALAAIEILALCILLGMLAMTLTPKAVEHVDKTNDILQFDAEQRAYLEITMSTQFRLFLIAVILMVWKLAFV